MNRKGFTLIELLVVIAIIGLLSTLAIVALGTARLKSRDARRVADLKQIQTALELYASDNNGMYLVSSSVQLGDANHACLDSTGFHVANGCVNAYLSSVPKDPKGGYYLYYGANSDYSVYANLEGTVNTFSGTISASPNSGTNSTGLVGWWRFDEGGGAWTAYDSSGNGYDAHLNGTQTSGSFYSAGRVGTWSGNFNGTDNSAQITNSASTFSSLLAGGSAFSVFAWVNPANCTNAFASIFDKFLTDGFRLYLSNCQLMTQTRLPLTTNTGPTILGSAWSLVGVTFSSTGDVTFYVNGFPTSGGTNVTAWTANNVFPKIGYAVNNGTYFSGLIDDVRLYNRVLSAAEVQAIYNAQK